MDADVDVLWTLFRRIDRSRDGNISLRELSQARKRGDFHISPVEAKALMRFSDEDDNGNKQLTFPAFYVASTGMQLDPKITPSILKNFTSLDMNNDGYVDRKDLLRAIEAGMNLNKNDMKEFLKAADADGDKRISLSEYVAVFASKAKSRGLLPEDEAMLRKQFSLLDDNGDGYISKSELRKLAKSMPFKSKELLQVFTVADMDGDGTISFEEFVEHMQVQMSV